MTNRSGPSQNYLSRVRGIPLLPEEKVATVFSLEGGLLQEPTSKGILLLVTNYRILFFANKQNSDEASLLPVEELKGVTVQSRTSNSYSFLKGILLVGAALVFYLIVAYWLAGQVEGPGIPGLAIDLLPFILLAAIAAGVVTYWRHNVHRAGGQVTLQGDNWDLSFVYLGAERIPEINDVVKTLFICRQERTESFHSFRETEAASSG